MGAKFIALQEQAEDLGFSTIQEAINADYEVEYHAHGEHKLVKPSEEELAHRVFLQEKRELLAELDACINLDRKGWRNIQRTLEKAREFIGGCDDR